MDTAEAATAQRPIKNEVIFLQNFKPQFTCHCLSDNISLGNVRTIHTIQCKSVLKNDHFFSIAVSDQKYAICEWIFY